MTTLPLPASCDRRDRLDRSNRLDRALTALALAAALASGALGCGGGTLNAKVAKASPFPSREALAKLASAPVAPLAAQKVAVATEWTVDPNATAAPSLAEAKFAQAAAKSASGLTFSKELRCVARELARFHLEQREGNPDERLARFMVAACGVTTPEVLTGGSIGEMPLEMTDEQILADWQAKLKVPSEYRGAVVGVWLARKERRVVIATAVAMPHAEVVVSPADASGVVVVRGAAPGNTEAVLALMNQGDKGVTTCEADPATPLPLFTFRCRMAESDKQAWVEVATRAQGRLLQHTMGLALARRDTATPLSYAATPHAPRLVTSATELAQVVLEGVNGARAAAKLAPLALARGQSTTNERLAPHFFHASKTNDEAKGDLVSLGLIAGWEVEGMIRNGGLYAALLSGTADASGWLDYALDMPMGRYTMLQPNARQIAVGAAPTATVGGIGAVVTTYDLFGGDDHKADAARVLQHLARVRAARSLPQPVAMQGQKTLATEAALVNAGKKDADDALNTAMMAERDRSGRGVRGWVFSTNDLGLIPFPPELLAAGPLSVGIEVTHFRPEGAAWGSYVVFLMTPQADAPGLTAAAKGRTKGL
jgi:hypothetical protein